MHRTIVFLLLLGLLVGACGGSAPQADLSDSGVLTVTDGSAEVDYTVQDLEAMEPSQASFQDVRYVGVPLAALLRDAGYNPESLSAVKVTAVDGFSANYDPQLVTQADTLVSYARSDGPLAKEEGLFRMVLPEQAGKMNPRQVVEIRVIP